MRNLLLYQRLFKILTVFPVLFLSLGLSACSKTLSESELAETPQETSEEMPHDKASDDYFANPPSIPDLASGKVVPPTGEELQAQFAKSSKRWFYGNGIGTTMLNVGTVVVFPPYALYLLGNAGLALAGFEQLYITDALPKASRKQLNSVYDEFTSVPGRLNAAIAREEFQEKLKKE